MNTKSTLSESIPISEAEARELAEIWYQYLDVHVPVNYFVPLLADEGLTMIFPEGTMVGFAEFKGWYDGVINTFFDEVHTLKEVKVTPKGDRTD